MEFDENMNKITSELFEIIKTSETDEEIIERLMGRFGFTSYQADLISNMKLKNQSSQFQKLNSQLTTWKIQHKSPTQLKKLNSQLLLPIKNSALMELHM